MSRAFAVLMLAVSLTLGLSSCAVDEKDEVATYRSLIDANKIIVQHDDSATLSVIDSMALANSRNESLSIQGETYLQSLIAERRALAAFLPTITLTPSYVWRDQPNINGNRDDLDTPITTSLSVNPVRDFAALGSAEATAAEQRALLLEFQDTFLIDVARTHYGAVRAEREVDVLENSSRVQDERVIDARARLEAGMVSPLDLSLAEAQAAETATQLIEARLRARTVRTALAHATATPMTGHELVDTLTLPNPIPPEAVFLAQALATRQEILASERHIAAAAKGVESAYGEYFPTVSLDLAWFIQRDSEPSDLDWTSLIRVSVPLFSAGLIEADVRDALSQLRAAKLRYSLVRRTIARDVSIASDNLGSSFDRAERLRVEVRASSDALEQAEGLYVAGLATNLERLAAQERLLSAQLDLVRAELDEKVFWLDLMRVAGSLHDLLGITRERPAPTDLDPTLLKDPDAVAR